MPHVFLIVLENHSFSQVVGNPQLPYFNSLVGRFQLATNYHAVAHPSLPNYLALTSGSTFGIQSDCGCIVTADHIGDQLDAAGIGWKAYMEGLTVPCGTGGPGYTTNHSPFVHYQDLVGNAARCAAHVVPFDQFGRDLLAGTIPAYAWITPNVCDDMHSCAVGVGDRWLSAVVPQILGSDAWQQDGVLIITFDEGQDSAGGGGQVATVVATPGLGPGTVSQGLDHYALLATVEDLFGLPRLGRAAGAASLAALIGS